MIAELIIFWVPIRMCSWIFLVQQVLLHRQLCSTVPRKPARQGRDWSQRIASCEVATCEAELLCEGDDGGHWGGRGGGSWRPMLGDFKSIKLTCQNSSLHIYPCSLLNEQLMLGYFLRANLPELSPLYCFRISALCISAYLITVVHLISESLRSASIPRWLRRHQRVV